MTTTATRGATPDSYVEITPGVCAGKPRIAGRRITVQTIANMKHMGINADKIASNYNLSLAEVHAALAYYFDNHKEIEKSIREGLAFAEEMPN